MGGDRPQLAPGWSSTLALVTTYVVLLRGINVGGRNPVPMARLREVLGELGYRDVVTYIASGNVILRADHAPARVKREIEDALPKAFTLHTESLAVHVLTAAQLQAVVANRPRGFGDAPGTYHSDTIFLMGIEVEDAMAAFDLARAWTESGQATASSTPSG